ncbi:MAG: CpsD/CapB family tyrosine-protein kinase, partial [Bariatricus sp.]
GFLLAMAWTALLVVTRRTVRKEEDIHRWMHTRCLGSVPEIHEKRRTRSSQMRKVLTDPKIDEKFLESFRMIRNKVEYSAHTYHMKTFLITSALAGEGKSTVAVNLALSLAQAGKKVALIDCDLRHPTDRKILNLDPGDGLAEVLEQKMKMPECLIGSTELGLPSDVELIFLPGGSAVKDGSEFLGTELMKSIIKKMEEWADYVILDSAPAGLLTDAVVLAQYADGAIFVVRKDFARVDYIMDGMEHLAESRIQIIGGILNGA